MGYTVGISHRKGMLMMDKQIVKNAMVALGDDLALLKQGLAQIEANLQGYGDTYGMDAGECRAYRLAALRRVELLVPIASEIKGNLERLGIELK